MNKALLLGTGLALLSFGAHAADLAIEAKPVAAAPSTSSYSGYVEVSGNGTNWDDWGADYNPWLGFGGAAALAYQLDNNWQIEAELTTWVAGDSYYKGYYNARGTLAALHANYSLDGASVGGFVGATAFNDYEYEGVDYAGIVGVEGSVNVTDNLILNGQVGYLGQFSGYYGGSGSYYPGYAANLGFAQADVKFFPLDNLELSAYVGLVKGDLFGSAYKASAVTYGAEIAYQFEDTPLSVFASYSGYTDNDYFDSSAQTVKVGARFSFDGESLKDQAKTGASHSVADLSPVSWLRLGW